MRSGEFWRVLSSVLALSAVLGCGGELRVASSPARAEPADAFAALRQRWFEMLTGNAEHDAADPDVSAAIAGIADKAQEHWDSLRRTEDTELGGAARAQAGSFGPHLWDDLAELATTPAHIRGSYVRLRDMALALKTEGSRLQGNQRLRADILAALAWLQRSYFHDQVETYGNWWEWRIGIPLAVLDTLILLYDDLPRAQVEGYDRAMERFVGPSCDMTGANRVWLCTANALRGAVVGRSELLATSRDGLTPTWQLVTTGDGFYADGSFIQHDKHPYSGGYGLSLLSSWSAVLGLLHGSPWDVVDPSIANVYTAVTKAFLPLLHRGEMMDMVRGREVSRVGWEDVDRGALAYEAILRLAAIAPPAIARDYESRIKAVIAAQPRSYLAGWSVSSLERAKALLSDPTIPARGDVAETTVFAAMDRVVHHRSSWAFGLSMYSNRIYNYESINEENLRGWYQGSGATYLYDADEGRYSGAVAPTIDAHRLAGTTVLRGAVSTPRLLSPNPWTGGAVVLGRYAVAGMDSALPGAQLAAKKSWFMLDDEVVALGAGIRATESGVVETIVENRKLSAAGSNALTVDGHRMPGTMGWSEILRDVGWIHLAGNVAGSDTGYYFPGRATLESERSERADGWWSINHAPDFEELGRPEHTNRYLTLWFDHGPAPLAARYAYVLLPNASAEAVAAYAMEPSVEIWSNTERVQAVFDRGLRLLAANFWEDRRTAVRSPTEAAPYLACDHKASVLVLEESGLIHVSIADPTQQNSGDIRVELARAGAAVDSLDPEITVVELRPRLKLRVRVAGTGGRTLRAVIRP